MIELERFSNLSSVLRWVPWPRDGKSFEFETLMRGHVFDPATGMPTQAWSMAPGKRYTKVRNGKRVVA